MSDKEINYELLMSGPLFVDEKYKKPGFKYAFVADRPGEIETYTRWGYEVVKDEIEVGEKTKKPSQSNKFGAAVTVQSKCGATLVFMAITDELHEKLMKYREGKGKQLMGSLGKIENVPEDNQYGSIKIK